MKTSTQTHRPCRVAGCCNSVASRHGVYCEAHYKATRRHGHPLQRATSKAMLRPLLKRIERRIERNTNVKWDLIEARWAAVVTHSRETMKEWHSGKVMIRWDREAASAVIRLADDVQPMAVVKTVIAMYLHQAQNPRHYQSDRAFEFQVVRRCLGLTRRNAGVYWDHASGKSKTVYRDPHPKTTQKLADWIKQSLGVVGVYFVELERKEVEAKAKAHHEFRDALTSIR